MQIRFSLILSGAVFLVGTQTMAARGEDIRPYVNSNGRIVFTNLLQENVPVQPSAAAVRSSQSVDSKAQISAPIQNLVETISANHGVDPALVNAVIRTESNFNRYAVSNKGAKGLMQLIPSTGLRYGVRDFFDPQQNIDGGVRHLKFLLEKFHGNLDLSLAAYNAGENLVERLGRVPSIPETTNYVRKIRSIYKTKSTIAASAAAPSAASGTAMTAASAPEPPRMYKMVDARGVVHFSNIEPPN
jgi:soluble lytic murein transglycosylase-like protein